MDTPKQDKIDQNAMDNELPEEIEPIKTEAQLPFDTRKQEATIGHLRQNDSFLVRARGIIKYKWFGSGVLGKIWEALSEFYRVYRRCPGVEELKGEFANLTMAEANEIYAAIDRCEAATKIIQLDVIQNQCTCWLQAQLIIEASENLNLLYNREQIDKAMKYVYEKFPQIQQANFSPNMAASFTNTKQTVLEKFVLDCQNACTTGCKQFDEALLKGPPGTIGGLVQGELTVIMAPISKGKTSTMITVAVQNIMRDKDVLFLAHEDINNIVRKILMCALKCPSNELVARYQDPKQFELILEWEKRLERHLVYIPMDRPGGTFVEDVVAAIQERQKERRRQYGKGFDLLIDDFPAKLLTRNGKYDDYRHRMYFIYEQFASLAANEHFHALVAVQSNRDGARANLEGNRALGMEDTSEAWGIPQLAHNFITINRSEGDRALKIIKYHIAKCRGEDTGKIITCQSRFEWNQTHGDDIGACVVEGSWTATGRKETAAGGVGPNGETISNDNGELTENGRLVKIAKANTPVKEIQKQLADKLIPKEEKPDPAEENTPAYCLQPEDGPTE